MDVTQLTCWRVKVSHGEARDDCKPEHFRNARKAKTDHFPPSLNTSTPLNHNVGNQTCVSGVWDLAYRVEGHFFDDLSIQFECRNSDRAFGPLLPNMSRRRPTTCCRREAAWTENPG